MLRLKILNQLQKVPVILLCNQATTLSTQLCKTGIVTKVSTVFPIDGSTRNVCLSSSLQKYNRKSGAQDVDTDSDEEDDLQFKDERDSKVIKSKVNSLRADLLVKVGLGIARNKIESIFYESKIRVNGKKLAKKSAQLNEGDEIDVIRGFSQENPSHLVVSRVILLSASEKEEGYSVHLRRYKVLLIENYSGLNAFKASSIA